MIPRPCSASNGPTSRRQSSPKLVIDAASCRRVAFQAASLTAFNTSNRAFLGGVSVEMADNVELLLPRPAYRSLNEALHTTGFVPKKISAPSQTIYFDHSPAKPETSSCRADCDGWRGAVSDFDNGLHGSWRHRKMSANNQKRRALMIKQNSFNCADR